VVLYQAAPKVRFMFAALLGIALGVGLYMGPLMAWRNDVSLFAARIVEASDGFLHSLLEKAPYASSNPKLVTVLSVVLSVCAPGIVAVLLVAAANAAGALRSALSALLVVVTLGSFLVLPTKDALILTAVSVAAALLLLLPAIFVARILLWSLATILAFDHVSTIWAGTAPSIIAGETTLAQLTGFATTDFWRYALVAIGIAPFALTATVIFGPE